MILIDSSFWAAVGVTLSDGNPDGTQYGFYNSIEMANGETVYNQYEFFKNSEVDSVFYNDQYEWYKAVGVLYSEPIYDQYSFYQNVTLDGVNPIGNQYEFFKGLTDPVSGLAGLDKIFADYNFTNMWSSENLLVDGTDTTLHDYASEHNLINPAAANQPTFNATDSDFGNKPSLTYDGTTDYSYKAVSGWRGSDSSGVFISVCKMNAGTDFSFLTSGNEAGTTPYAYQTTNTNSLRFIHHNGSAAISGRGSTVVNDSAGHVMAYGSTGSAFKVIIDSNNDTVVMVSGTDAGEWLDAVGGRDNIAIGNLVRSTNLFSSIDWVMSGYLPYVSDANIIALQDELTTYYGL